MLTPQIKPPGGAPSLLLFPRPLSFFRSLRSILTSVAAPCFLNKRALRETALKGSNGGMEIRRLIGLAGLQPAGPFQYRPLLFSLKCPGSNKSHTRSRVSEEGHDT